MKQPYSGDILAVSFDPASPAKSLDPRVWKKHLNSSYEFDLFSREEVIPFARMLASHFGWLSDHIENPHCHWLDSATRMALRLWCAEARACLEPYTQRDFPRDQELFTRICERAVRVYIGISTLLLRSSGA